MISKDQRLADLEQQLNWLKRGVTLLAVVVLIFVTVAAATGPGINQILTTKKIEIVNEKGDPVLVLDQDEFGGRLTISNSEGAVIVTAKIYESGCGSVAVQNIEGKGKRGILPSPCP